jgi:hypothetical protein
MLQLPIIGQLFPLLIYRPTDWLPSDPQIIEIIVALFCFTTPRGSGGHNVANIFLVENSALKCQDSIDGLVVYNRVYLSMQGLWRS